MSCGAAAGVLDHLGQLVLSINCHQPLVVSGALAWTLVLVSSGVPFRTIRTHIEGARKPERAELGRVAPLFRPHLVLKRRQILGLYDLYLQLLPEDFFAQRPGLRP